MQYYDFDFFNYAGIHRSVYVYAVPAKYIQDVRVHTAVSKQGDSSYAGTKFILLQILLVQTFVV